jgi:flavorubredoxin
MPRVTENGTTIDEIAEGIYRISTPVPPSAMSGGFSFNRYLVADEAPLLFHSGLRGIVHDTLAAIATVMPVTRLRYVAVSHFESDECGALNQLLAAAPQAVAIAGQVGAMVSLSDYADRPPRGLNDGEALSLGAHTLEWLDTPHMPHAWDCGYMFDRTTATLFCGDLFTQGGDDNPPLTSADILEPSEAFRVLPGFDYFSYTRNARPLLGKLAARKPTTLACMHGSAWEGDGGALLTALADRLAA